MDDPLSPRPAAPAAAHEKPRLDVAQAVEPMPAVPASGLRPVQSQAAEKPADHVVRNRSVVRASSSAPSASIVHSVKQIPH